ncbi:hypothetical protein AGLY_010876 [Aphis glycines]|uniref:Uncharacterized protein n=1 Tax=Aphis glycines TaxID=307491 RepID=A0A6G0TG45_APHGL|nr:hypothetical protein AGLY_010876 [Aphis glycines]
MCTEYFRDVLLSSVTWDRLRFDALLDIIYHIYHIMMNVEKWTMTMDRGLLRHKPCMQPACKQRRRKSELERRRSELVRRKSELVRCKSKLGRRKSVQRMRVCRPGQHKSELVQHKSELVQHKSELVQHKSELVRHKSELGQHKSELEQRKSAQHMRVCRPGQICKLVWVRCNRGYVLRFS